MWKDYFTQICSSRSVVCDESLTNINCAFSVNSIIDGSDLLFFQDKSKIFSPPFYYFFCKSLVLVICSSGQSVNTSKPCFVLTLISSHFFQQMNVWFRPWNSKPRGIIDHAAKRLRIDPTPRYATYLAWFTLAPKALNPSVTILKKKEKSKLHSWTIAGVWFSTFNYKTR